MDHTPIRGRYLGSLLKTLDAPEQHWRRLKIASRADTVEQAQDRHWYGFMYNSNLLARVYGSWDQHSRKTKDETCYLLGCCKDLLV